MSDETTAAEVVSEVNEGTPELDEGAWGELDSQVSGEAEETPEPEGEKAETEDEPEKGQEQEEPAEPEKPAGEEEAEKPEGEEAAKPAEGEEEAEPEKEAGETAAGEEKDEGEKPDEPAQPDADELKKLYEKQREEALKTLEETYKLSDEEAELLESEPAKVLPKLGARLVVDAVEEATRAVFAQMPNFLENYNRVSQAQREAEERFFERWPKLKDHVDEVRRIGTIYRANNPNASVDDYIAEVGAAVMVAKRIPLEDGKPDKPTETPVRREASLRTTTPQPERRKKPAAKTLEDQFAELDVALEEAEMS